MSQKINVLVFCLALFALGVVALPSHAQSNRIIYDDALENNWYNWSWCTTNLNCTSPVHSGTHSIQVTYTAAWQALYLDQSAGSTAGYANLTFWINGGATGGQNILIRGVRNNNSQPGVPLNSYITGGSIAANTWRQVTVPLAALGVANVNDLTGFWIQEDSGQAQPTFYVDDITLTVAAQSPPVTAPIQMIYDDALENNWYNWSWCPTNLNCTSPVHSGTHSIQVTYTAAWQALYLDQGPISSAGYDSLTFWINGGATGGQNILIRGLRSNNSQPGVPLNSYITGGSIAANTWRQVTVPLAALSVANVNDLTGFWIQEDSGQAQPTFYVDDIGLTISNSPNPAVTLAVDAGANRHAINPNIYGVAYATTQQLLDLNCPINRMGGNNTSRYNWQLNADNKGSDWFFESIGDSNSTPGYRVDSFIGANKAAAAQSMITIPMINWIANLGSNRSYLDSFSVKKYGAQTSTDPYWSDAGNGVHSSNGQDITGNNPGDANVPNSPALQQGWINHLVSTWNTAAKGGLKYYILDNEPSSWHGTHRDVHPVGATMSEIYNDILSYGAKVKAADPSALLVGPEEWGWDGYFYSGYDQQYGSLHGWSYLPDRNANGNADYLPWLLSQLYKHDQTNHTRSLDVFTVHYYPQSGEYSNDTSLSTQNLRNRSTRSLWDPNYVDQSWIGAVVELIPRLQGWVAQNYPGLQVGLTEYSWGADGYINGATAQADVWGILGRQGVDLATRWTVPNTGTPTYNAMKLIRNYDGNGSAFGDVSVSDSVPNPDNLASFAAQRTVDGALTVLVINKGLLGNTPVTLNLANFTASGVAHAYQLTSANVITQLADLGVTGNSLSFTAPAQSITLLVLPKK